MIYDIIIGTISSIIGNLITNIKNIFPKLEVRLFNKKRYITELKKLIEGMPFLYNDMDSRIVDDFVDLEFEFLDPDTLIGKSYNKVQILRNNQKFKDLKKVVFLGDAGIGKTTFQRFVIMKIILKYDTNWLLYEKERITPIYIPLKVIKNDKMSPIIRYILTNNRLFKGRNGFKRLKKNITGNKIYIFLDGYDEAMYGDSIGNVNFIHDEIKVIFSPDLLVERIPRFCIAKNDDRLRDVNNPMSVYEENKNNKIVHIEEEFKDLYESMKNIRVWLSSRTDFYRENKIDNSLEKKKGYSILTVVRINGVNTHRMNLIGNIFNKHIQKDRFLNEYLNSEYFLTEIDRMANDIRDISNNPLFLTILCYLYVEKVKRENNCSVDMVENIKELIDECINLLLKNLDEYKARDLPTAKKLAVLRRRNEHIDIKKIFLPYFAGKLYIEEKNTFDIDDLKEKILIFLKEYEFDESAHIIEEISNFRFRNTNFIMQLIYSGIFIVVDIQDNKTYYDFAHRRFREVLATKFFSHYQNYHWLLVNCNRPFLKEFISFFRQTSEFKNPSLHTKTLECILSNKIFSMEENYFSSINFVKALPENINIFKELKIYILETLEGEKLKFILDKSLLKMLLPEKEFMSLLKSSLFKINKNDDIEKISFLLSILHYFDISICNQWLLKNLNLFDNELEQDILYFHLFLNSPEKFIQRALSEINNPENFKRYCQIIVEYGQLFDEQKDNKIFWWKLNNNGKAIFIQVCFNYKSELYLGFMNTNHTFDLRAVNALGRYNNMKPFIKKYETHYSLLKEDIVGLINMMNQKFVVRKKIDNKGDEESTFKDVKYEISLNKIRNQLNINMHKALNGVGIMNKGEFKHFIYNIVKPLIEICDIKCIDQMFSIDISLNFVKNYYIEEFINKCLNICKINLSDGNFVCEYDIGELKKLEFPMYFK